MCMISSCRSARRASTCWCGPPGIGAWTIPSATCGPRSRPTGRGHADRAGAPTRGAAGPPGDRDGALVLVLLCPPTHRRAEKLPTLAVWAVLAREDHPPAGVEPLEWRLLTTCAVHTPEDAVARVTWYACRWGIEVWHKVLKSGCRLEARQLETAERLRRCLAVYSVIAWRILYATMLSRAMPEAPCTALLEPEEWQALYCTIHMTRHAAGHPAHLAPGGPLDWPPGGLLGPSGRWRTWCHRVVERVSASDRSHDHVSYHVALPPRNEKMWVKLSPEGEGE